MIKLTSEHNAHCLDGKEELSFCLSIFLYLGNNKTVCDYVWVGTAHPDLYAKAVSEGKKAPFYNQRKLSG